MRTAPILAVAAGMLLSTGMLVAQDAQPSPQELGKVSWLRDYDMAVARSKKVNKPIFLLFQEVPG